MILSLTLALLAQAPQGPMQLAPHGTPLHDFAAPKSKLGGNPAALEAFESYAVGVGSAENILSLALFDGTVTGTGQGPGLVLPGCTYFCNAGSLQWNGDTYFGLATKTFMANSGDSHLGIRYYTPQSTVTFDLHAFDGFPDTAKVNGYDATGALVASAGPYAVPDSTPVPASISGPGITRIEILGTYSWSPIIDNHDYLASAGTLQLSIIGPCPGVNSVTVNGGVPGNACKIAYAFGTGAYVIPGGPCAGTVLGLDASVTPLPGTWIFNGAGQVMFNQFIPAGACGAVFVQAIEAGTCNTSNVVAL